MQAFSYEDAWSPLMRGAWIETPHPAPYFAQDYRRPSCEGRGLKLDLVRLLVYVYQSPLMRGAWIETTQHRKFGFDVIVAPHARGVD